MQERLVPFAVRLRDLVVGAELVQRDGAGEPASEALRVSLGVTVVSSNPLQDARGRVHARQRRGRQRTPELAQFVHRRGRQNDLFAQPPLHLGVVQVNARQPPLELLTHGCVGKVSLSERSEGRHHIFDEGQEARARVVHAPERGDEHELIGRTGQPRGGARGLRPSRNL